ncbi:unnamed protein product [Peniophora sp. CBMAI 1063]|nr:unnamed protein product [Peniophora sp. CBMAI 1063]
MRLKLDALEEIFTKLKATQKSKHVLSLGVADGLRESLRVELVEGIIVSLNCVAARHRSPSDDVATFSVSSSVTAKELSRAYTVRFKERSQQFMSTCNAHPPSRGLGGIIFENFGHSLLSEAPIEWRTRLRLTPIRAYPLPPSDSLITIDTLYQHRALLEFFSDKLPDHPVAEYCKPSASNNATFDAVVYARNGDPLPSASGSEPVPQASSSTQTLLYPESPAMSPTQDFSQNELEALNSLKRPADSAAGGRRSHRRIAEEDSSARAHHCIALQMTVSNAHGWKEKGFVTLDRAFKPDGIRHFVIVTPSGVSCKAKTLLRRFRAANVEQYSETYCWYHLEINLEDTQWGAAIDTGDDDDELLEDSHA